MAFKLFLVFVALAAVIEFSGRCRGQLNCIFKPCKRQEQADDSVGFKVRAPEPNEFRRYRKMQLADFLGSFKRPGKRSNLQDDE